MALEAVAGNEFEDVLELERVIDVFGEDVFVERPAGRPVHVHKVALHMVAGQLPEEVAQQVRRVPRQPVVQFDLAAGPADRPLRAGVEPVRIKERALVVIAQDHDTAPVPHELDALAGIWPVAHHVAQTDHVVHSLPVDIGEDGLEGLEVAVDVADDGPLHVRFQR